MRRYQLHPASAPIKCQKDTKDAHSQEENKKREKKKTKTPITVMKNSQQQHSNHHRRQHLDYKSDSSKATPPKRKQCTSVVRSKILSFRPGESPSSPKNNAFNKVITRYNQCRLDLGFSPWESRLGTRGAPPKMQSSSAAPRLPRPLLQVSKHPSHNLRRIQYTLPAKFQDLQSQSP